jgi:hypothetical protein
MELRSQNQGMAGQLEEMAKELFEKEFFSFMKMRDHNKQVETRFGGIENEVSALKSRLTGKVQDRVSIDLTGSSLDKEAPPKLQPTALVDAPMFPLSEERSSEPTTSWVQVASKRNSVQKHSGTQQSSSGRAPAPSGAHPPSKSPKVRQASRKVTVEPMSKLFQQQTAEGTLQKLLKKSALNPFEKTKDVLSRVVSVPFKTMAAASAMKSWKHLIRQFLEPNTILNISVIHPTKAQIFFDARNAGKVDEFLKRIRAEDATHKVRDQDVVRLAATYLRGYFKLLRREVIWSLETNLAMEVLAKASELIGSKEFFHSNKILQLVWKDYVVQDRKELLRRKSQIPEAREPQVPGVIERAIPATMVSLGPEAVMPQVPNTVGPQVLEARRPLVLEVTEVGRA